MTPLVVLILFVLASILICHQIARKRGANPVFWGVMGALFGPLAIPFVFMSKRRTKVPHP